MLPQVVKRDGSTEKFSIINIAKVVTAAGLNPDQAKAVSEKIATWAESQKVDSLTSLQIRDQVLKELLTLNENAADLYKWYEQSKDL